MVLPLRQLPELLPELDFELMNETEQALLFSFEAKKDALGAHIAVRWGWDEGFQLNVHRQRFRERPFSVILRDGQPAGTLSWLTTGSNHVLNTDWVPLYATNT